jgi:hemerythrin
MERIIWADEFHIGIDFFDEQHEHLVKLLDQLIAASENSSLADVTSALLSEFMDLTFTHFSDEEDFMAKHDFPILPEHKILHQEFVTKAQELHQLSTQLGKPVPIALVTFLRIWLLDHIVNEDKKYLVCIDASQPPA